MEKPAALREAIQAALPEFKTDPDRLRIYVDGGEIEPARGTLSHKTAYTLNLFAQEIAKDKLTRLNIAIIHWLQRNQPDILNPGTNGNKAYTFEAEPLTSDVWDVLIQLKLTENILVRMDDKGRLNIKTKAEPQYDLEDVLGQYAAALGVPNDNQIGG
ncbi:phage tail protein [Neisseria sp. N95_16]|uniref:Phage tail protein n=1 Tax=Neisseria brasiliensis TaxID=2666100 RepID=A0A7X2GWM2_9NEIS|nr:MULTISPECIES: phage tail protein [Neisseria]MRN37199.1 phage tail protein [Neisseria brasiliensis]PJO10082.1 phage tail protein [Neisseria sp. N95_16]